MSMKNSKETIWVKVRHMSVYVAVRVSIFTWRVLLRWWFSAVLNLVVRIICPDVSGEYAASFFEV